MKERGAGGSGRSHDRAGGLQAHGVSHKPCHVCLIRSKHIIPFKRRARVHLEVPVPEFKISIFLNKLCPALSSPFEGRAPTVVTEALTVPFFGRRAPAPTVPTFERASAAVPFFERRAPAPTVPTFERAPAAAVEVELHQAHGCV